MDRQGLIDFNTRLSPGNSNMAAIQDRAVRRYEIPEEVPMMTAEDRPEYNNIR